MDIIIELRTELGNFRSDILTMDEDQYQKLIEISKNYYNSGYEMPLHGSFLVASPNIVKNSILIIERQDEK